MTECTFCDGHGVTELWVDDNDIDDKVCLWLCLDCTESYDQARELYNND